MKRILTTIFILIASISFAGLAIPEPSFPTSGLVHWWEGSDYEFNVGDVAHWHDRISGAIATQSTEANKPLKQNGCLFFTNNSTAQCLNPSGGEVATYGTVVLVFDALYPWMGNQKVFAFESASNGFMLWNNNTQVRASTGGNLANLIPVRKTPGDPGHHTVIWYQSPSQMEVWQDGALWAYSTSTYAKVNFDRGCIGAKSGNVMFGCYLRRILIYNRNLTKKEIQTLSYWRK